MVVKVLMVVTAVVVFILAIVNVTAPRQGRWLAIAATPGSGGIVIVSPWQILPSTRCPLVVAAAPGNLGRSRSI
jgi:hypothetical protein